MTATISRSQLKRLAENAGPGSPWHELLKASSKRSKRAKARVDLPPSQGRVLTFTIPMPESLTNSGKGRSRSWWSKARAQKEFRRMLDERANAGLLPRVPDSPLGRVLVTSTMYLGHAMDEDNAMARHKWVLDWIQRSGYLVDDRHAKWSGQPTQVVKRGQEYRIELTLAEPVILSEAHEITVTLTGP